MGRKERTDMQWRCMYLFNFIHACERVHLYIVIIIYILLSLFVYIYILNIQINILDMFAQAWKSTNKCHQMLDSFVHNIVMIVIYGSLYPLPGKAFGFFLPGPSTWGQQGIYHHAVACQIGKVVANGFPRLVNPSIHGVCIYIYRDIFPES